ncbi:uncharacterized protein LOC113979035 [Neopelma chrysocephalum]|uniref:uncharacterized protein LOC113979035 n=1 Tax=Neopelma chrysocephalum TaxID=114329 RepID=UPI000FCD4A70|nr:uncharacterized protein LOC113979035 [Neopelma chrysocephalum]
MLCGSGLSEVWFGFPAATSEVEWPCRGLERQADPVQRLYPSDAPGSVSLPRIPASRGWQGPGPRCQVFQLRLPAELGGRGGKRCRGAAGMEPWAWISYPCVFPIQPDRSGHSPLAWDESRGSQRPAPGSLPSAPSWLGFPWSSFRSLGPREPLVPPHPSCVPRPSHGPGPAGRSGVSAAGDGPRSTKGEQGWQPLKGGIPWAREYQGELDTCTCPVGCHFWCPLLQLLTISHRRCLPAHPRQRIISNNELRGNGNWNIQAAHGTLMQSGSSSISLLVSFQHLHPRSPPQPPRVQSLQPLYSVTVGRDSPPCSQGTLSSYLFASNLYIYINIYKIILLKFLWYTIDEK